MEANEDFIWKAWHLQAARAEAEEPDADPTVKQEQADAEQELVDLVGRCQTLSMPDLANLLAAARSANDYQLTRAEIDLFRQVERVVVRISGAYAVPKAWQPFVKLPSEPDPKPVRDEVPPFCGKLPCLNCGEPVRHGGGRLWLDEDGSAFCPYSNEHGSGREHYATPGRTCILPRGHDGDCTPLPTEEDIGGDAS